MNISFHGAARTVTGSKHLIRMNDGRGILLDCGMFQGLGKDTQALNSHWGFDPRSIDHVIITHAHIDHCGLLPRLVKDGYQGKIYCTRATADLIPIMLPDSAHIQEADVQHVNKRREKKGSQRAEALYTMDDATAVFPLLEPVDYNQSIHVDEGIELLFTEAGHIIGTACAHLALTEEGRITRISFSGDIGRYNDLLLHAPEPFPQADYILLESTYGNSLHDPTGLAADKLLREIEHTCLQKQGRLIIPAFSVGRTQDILYMLNQLELQGRLPDLDYFVDSPLSISATNVVSHHPECFNDAIREVLLTDQDIFRFRGLKMISKVSESIALNDRTTPCVIIAASGMAEAGRVKHHIVHAIGDERNTILLTGYCEPQSLGGRLEARPRKISIYGEEFVVRAEINSIRSLSAHGDYEDLCRWLSCQQPDLLRKIFLVHGEYDVQVAFRERLRAHGYDRIEIPELHQEITLEPTVPTLS